MEQKTKQKNELLKDSQEQKLGILDLKTTINNQMVLIEMQKENTYNIPERALQYISKVYSEQLKTKEKYEDSQRVTLIIISNRNYLKTEKAVNDIMLMIVPEKNEKNNAENETYTDKIKIISIEIQKYLKREKKEKPTELDLWMWLFSMEKEWVEMALSAKAQAIQKAYEELEYLSQDEAAKLEYDSYVRAKYNESMQIYYATLRGERRGEQKGESRGRKFGLIEGGKNEKIKIIKNMLKKKMKIEDIVELTKASKKEIEEIEKEMNKKVKK